MTFAAVSPVTGGGAPPITYGGTSKTGLSVTTHAVGDFILLEVISETAADYAKALASSNVTWTVLVAHTTLSTYVSTVFIGEVTAVSTATVTITSNAGSPTWRIAGQEFSTTAGYSAVTLDASGTVAVSSDADTFPSLTPTHGSGELYFSYCYNNASGDNGSTSGFTYNEDANGNNMVFDAACGTGAQAPAIGTASDGLYGIAVLLYEQSSSTPVSQADVAGAVESMGIAVSSADVAGAADTMAETVAAPQGDAAGAVDKLAVSATAPSADVAGAAESMSVAISIPVSPADVAGAADTMAEAVTAPQADAAGAADSLAVSAVTSAADVAAGTDAMAITVGPATPDVAGAVDSAGVTVSAPQHEAAGAVDSMSFPDPIAATAPDVAGAADKAVVAATVPQADVAGAADSIAVHAVAPAADVAAAYDALSFPVPIAAPQPDAAGAVDSIFVAKGGGSTFINTLPGGGGSYALPAGYQGGPSGAGAIAPSSLGNSWEIEVRSSTDYSTLLAVIPGTMLLNWQFVRQLNDIGSGTVVLSQDDPWWAEVTLPGGLTTETLLDDECLWQVWKDGVCRFDFLGETITEQLVDPSEQRQVTITGPGTIATLKWAMVAPQGFPDIVIKLDGLLDDFDEVDDNGNPVLDTNIWTTATPSADIYITPISVIYNYPTGAGYALSTLYPSGSLTLAASPDTTYLGASPYDATDTLISAQVTPIGVNSSTTDSTTPATYGTGLDGSELTQFYIQSNFDDANYALIGLSATAFYAQLGSGGQVQTQILPAYDPTNHAYWMITEQAGSGGGSGTFYFWTSPDAQNWTQQWTIVHSWDATNVTFYVTATYDTAGTQTVLLTNLNSNVTTPSYQGPIYLGEPMMGVWFDQFLKAQGRGTIPFVTSAANGGTDSFGRGWTDTENVQAVNGTDLYSLLQGATSVVDADYVMNPGFQLVVGMPATGEVAVGVDRSDYIIFRDGVDVMARQRTRARDQIATLIGGENSDGHEISASAPTYIEEWGQREAWFQTSAQVDPTSMAYATAASLAENETEIVSWTFTLTPNLPGKTIFDNFDVGDWVGLERPDFSAVDTVRVVGIAVQVDNAGNETHELTFLSYIQWLAEQLTYLANKLGGSFVNTLGTTPVAPSKFGTGQVPTYFTPAATLQGLADVASSSVTSAQSNAPLVYNPATGLYQAAGSTDPVTGETIPVTVQTPSGSATLSDTSVVVNTGNGSTVVGLQGDGTVATTTSGGSAPDVPDLPSVAPIVQGLVVGWDGLLSSTQPLSSFAYVAVYVGTTSGFTPSASNQAGTLSQAGALSVGNLTAGATYYVKLAAYTSSGAASAATTGVTGVPGAVPTSLLTGQLPASLIGNSAGSALNPNPYFNGASLSGWVVTNGSVSAPAAPSGAPGAAQYAAEIVSTSANCLLTGSSAPFPVTPGQPYLMTAWVYNPGGSSVSVAIGFNWASGTTTVSVAAGAWVPLATVQTCPAGVTSAYQVIGPTASGKTVYVLGVVAAGQIPGQLLVANSVAAQQIAANTITAAQIAANTITAAQIAANTITAGQIAASTITAGQIAATTITAAQIAANTITAAQIAAGTITASQIVAGIVLAGAVNGTTITGASIVADGANGEILVYSGTPGSGNLILSVSAVSGSDAYGNGYAAGLWIYDSGGNSIGLLPGGSSVASQIALSTGNGTPTPPSGSASLYGAGSGAVQVVDGTDAQAYGTQRRSRTTGSTQSITSSTPNYWVSSTVAAPSSTARYYRVSGKAIVEATSSTGTLNFYFNGPSGIGGNVTFNFYTGSTFNTAGAVSAGGRASPSFTLASGTYYIVEFDGVVSIPAGTSGVMGIQAAATSGSSYSIAANSFMDVLPV